MRIRWKLLILLLTISLVPLFFVALLDHNSILRLGDDLAANARDALKERTATHLQQLIHDHAALLRRQRESLEHTVRAQARQVEQRLAAEPGKGRSFFNEDYESEQTSPPDMAPSDQHFRFAEGAKGTPIAVSFREQVCVLAPGVSRESVADDLARLSTMPAEYRFRRELYPNLIYWQYTSLQNGLHTSYPGHGGYPEEYDPRDRNWYRFARERGRLAWIGPYFDVSSEELILTVCMPVRRPNGSFAGVTGLDITVADVVAHMQLPSGLFGGGTIARDRPPHAGDPKSMLITLASDPEYPSRRRPRIIVRPGYHSKGERWDQQFDAEWLETSDSEQYASFIKSLENDETGDIQMPFDGDNSLWVYGPVDEGTHLVFILNYDMVVENADFAYSQAIERTDLQARMIGGVALLVILIVLLCALVGSRTVTEPIRGLVATADRIARGEFDARVSIRSSDEMARLGRHFNAMVPQLQERLELKQSLSLAKEVQQNLLPDAPPKIDGLDVAGMSVYCDETGGDYFDYLDLSEISPNRLGVVVGDVTGHGIAAAMLMTTGRALIRSRATQPGALTDLMKSLNRILDADMGADRFMTLFYMVLDREKRLAHWVTAGHDPAITYDPATDTFGELAGCDIPLGIEPDWEFTEHPPAELRDGEVIVIGTDGIWETRNPHGKFFGKEALREVIRANASRTADEIGKAIVEAVDQHRRQRPQEDDVTLVVIKVVPRAGDAA